MDNAGEIAGRILEFGSHVVDLTPLAEARGIAGVLTYVVPTIESPESGIERYSPIANVFASILEPASVLPVFIRVTLV